MRDINRIDPIVDKFTKIWKAVPDERFGQFISNLLSRLCTDHKVGDIWFPEDNKWDEWLQEELEKIEKGDINL